MEAVAKLKNCPMSARKMRLVVDLIRGKDIDEALDILRFTKKKRLPGWKKYYCRQLLTGNTSLVE
jgi:ribosomal protein L22